MNYTTIDIPTVDLNGNFIDITKQEDFHKILAVVKSQYPNYDFVQIVTSSIFSTASSNTYANNNHINLGVSLDLGLDGYIILREYTVKDKLNEL